MAYLVISLNNEISAVNGDALMDRIQLDSLNSHISLLDKYHNIMSQALIKNKRCSKSTSVQLIFLATVSRLSRTSNGTLGNDTAARCRFKYSDSIAWHALKIIVTKFGQDKQH